MVDAVIAHTAQEHPLERPNGTAPHDEQIGIAVGRHLADLLLGITHDHLRLHLHMFLGANLEGVLQDGLCDPPLVRLDGLRQRRNQGGRAGATAPPKISENF